MENTMIVKTEINSNPRLPQSQAAPMEAILKIPQHASPLRGVPDFVELAGNTQQHLLSSHIVSMF